MISFYNFRLSVFESSVPENDKQLSTVIENSTVLTKFQITRN